MMIHRIAIPLLAGVAAMAAAGAATKPTPPAPNPAWQEECGGCHLAYPPGLLPARSWRRITTGLERHFGSDASLDAATLQLIDRWLQAHGGSGKRGTEEPPEDRITRAAWFVREHRKIDAAAWKLASVRSAAHCAACHGAADRGRFDEGSLRLPEGLDARQRRAWND